MTAGAPAARRLAARAGFALALAHVRYWTSVAPTVRRELARWERRASAIEDPELKALALAKLNGEGFHAEAAAMLATFAPRAHRARVTEAIVALELLFDYLDGLSERPALDPLRAGERLFGALRDAFAAPPRDLAAPRCGDGGYLEELSHTVAIALARLPARSAVLASAQQLAARGGEAQTRMHAATRIGTAQLREWAQAETRAGEHGDLDRPEPGDLGWRELVAGAACAVLALHALLAASADPRTTPATAARLADAHLATSVLLTLLDGLVDGDGARTGRPSYLDLFEDHDELLEVLGQTTRRAARLTSALPDGTRQLMLLTSAVAYYASAPGAEGEDARVAIARARRELEPLFGPTHALMRAWRAIRRRTHSPRVAPVALATGLAAACLLAASAANAPGEASTHETRAQASHTLYVRDEGRLHYVKSSDTVILDEGRATGTLPGWVAARFAYDGEPQVSARFTIAAAGGSIYARASARLSSPSSLSPSFGGTMAIVGGSGRYAHVRGHGQLYGVYYRRSYALTVQAIATLTY